MNKSIQKNNFNYYSYVIIFINMFVILFLMIEYGIPFDYIFNEALIVSFCLYVIFIITIMFIVRFKNNQTWKHSLIVGFQWANGFALIIWNFIYFWIYGTFSVIIILISITLLALVISFHGTFLRKWFEEKKRISTLDGLLELGKIKTIKNNQTCKIRFSLKNNFRKDFRNIQMYLKFQDLDELIFNKIVFHPEDELKPQPGIDEIRKNWEVVPKNDEAYLEVYASWKKSSNNQENKFIPIDRESSFIKSYRSNKKFDFTTKRVKDS